MTIILDMDMLLWTTLDNNNDIKLDHTDVKKMGVDVDANGLVVANNSNK